MRRSHWGTPSRSSHYLKPRAAFALVRPWVLAGAGLALIVLVAHAVGVRRVASPGPLVRSHERIESRCEECHAPRAGASNVRCQRCHDPSGAPRLTHAAHVLFGSGDAKVAASAPALQCARCHVEHRGRRAALGHVEESECQRCHFPFSSHPEFRLLRDKAQERPGLKFPHDCHIRELIKEGGCKNPAAAPFEPEAARAVCVRCHEPSSKGRDLEPVSFDRHCATCHGKGGQLQVPVDPVSAEDVLSAEALPASPGRGEIETARGRVSKPVVRHRDPWVIANLVRLQRDLEPELAGAERDAATARLAQLDRRAASMAPLSALDLAGLQAREAALASELAGTEARLAALAAGAAPAGLARVEEVAAAAAAAQASSAELRPLLDKLKALGKVAVPAAALPAADQADRRQEILGLLDAVAAADAGLRPRVEDLRRRLQALAPGEDPVALLGRVRQQRQAQLERVRDELALRKAGVSPSVPALAAGQRRATDDAIRELRGRLDALSAGPDLGPRRTEADEERRRESADIVAAPCAKCHERVGVALAPVAATRSVLARARFLHEPHLIQSGADCLRCHPGIERSKKGSDLSLGGIAGCRQCHMAQAANQDCQSCHRYHAPVLP
jgi:hypothetical protein